MSITINDYFKSQYLTCGDTYDNYVFHNCPVELLDIVEKSLSKPRENCVPCILRFDREDEDRLSQTLDKCKDNYEKGIIARTYYLTRFMRELLAKTNKTYKDYSVEGLDLGVEALLSGDVAQAKKFYVMSPFFNEIEFFVRENSKIELDILLDNTSNVFLQKAINISLASRTPYSIKVFNTGSSFVSNYTTDGQLVEPTHDYLWRDVKGFIQFPKNDMSM